VGTGENVTVSEENRTYRFEKGLTYELKNDIVFNDNYSSIITKINSGEIDIKPSNYKISNNGAYYNANGKYAVAVNAQGYVTNGLQLLFDGKDNQGTGSHSNTATTWKDLSGNNKNGTLTKMDTNSCWTNEGLKFDGVDDCVMVTEMNYENVTLEAVASAKMRSKTQYVIANVEGGGYGIYFTSGKKLGAQIFGATSKAYKSMTSAVKTADRKYSWSGSYDASIQKVRWSGDTFYAQTVLNEPIGKPANNTYIAIGGNPSRNYVNADYLEGTVYCARIYNRALTDEEVSVNFLNDRDRYSV
jgi:hypothetical protein